MLADGQHRPVALLTSGYLVVGSELIATGRGWGVAAPLRAATVSLRDRRRSEIILLRPADVLAADRRTDGHIARAGGPLDRAFCAAPGWRDCAMRRAAGANRGWRRGRPGKHWNAVTPPPHLGRWSCRTMARTVGMSATSVQRLGAAKEIDELDTRGDPVAKGLLSDQALRLSPRRGVSLLRSSWPAISQTKYESSTLSSPRP
jgi:hypothetical protein